MKKLIKALVLSLLLSTLFSVQAMAATTFSEFWYQDQAGEWHAKDANGKTISNCWFCDDAVAGNGKDIWYLLDSKGNMISSPLVQDGTGSYYSLETNHEGYYGMLRYKSGTYVNDDQSIELKLESDHAGSFAAIKDPAIIEQLKALYGVTKVSIDNSNIVYSSELKASQTSLTAPGEEEKESKTPGTSGKGTVVRQGSISSGKTYSKNPGNYTVVPTSEGPGGESINVFTFNGKQYVVDYNWGKHYVTGYIGSGKTASGAYPTAGVTVAGPSSLLGKVCLIRGEAGPKGSSYDGLYKFEDTGGAAVETGTDSTMGVPVIDIYFNNYDEAMATTASGWTTVEVFILKEK